MQEECKTTSINLLNSITAYNMKKSVLYSVLITGMLMLCSYPVNAEIYKWVDDHGKVYFTDNPPEGKDTEKIELKINTYTSVEIKPLVERLGKTDKVVMYTATWCGICKTAKNYFQKNNIPYLSYDVEKSRVGKMNFKLLGGRSVPIIIVGDTRMNGFTASKFERLYKKQNKKQMIQAAANPDISQGIL